MNNNFSQEMNMLIILLDRRIQLLQMYYCGEHGHTESMKNHIERNKNKTKELLK